MALSRPQEGKHAAHFHRGNGPTAGLCLGHCPLLVDFADPSDRHSKFDRKTASAQRGKERGRRSRNNFPKWIGRGDGSDAFTVCLENSAVGLLGYRYDAVKAGFDHILFAFDENDQIQRKSFDPVAGLARNASNYQIEIADINGDGLDDFIAGTHPWFNECFSPEQRQGYTQFHHTVGPNDGAFGFEEATTYWSELIGMDADQAGRASQGESAKRPVAYYFGNWYRDFNRDGIADRMLFDRAQNSPALGGLPEASISYPIVTPDASAPEAPVIADSQFEDD